MGYPYNLDFEFKALARLNDYSINNLGDPFIESNYGVHSREFEVFGLCCSMGNVVEIACYCAFALGFPELPQGWNPERVDTRSLHPVWTDSFSFG